MDDILNQINDYDDYDDYDLGVKSGSSSSQDLQDIRSEPYLMHNAFNKPKQNILKPWFRFFIFVKNSNDFTVILFLIFSRVEKMTWLSVELNFPFDRTQI